MFFKLVFCISYFLILVLGKKTYNGFDQPEWTLASNQPEVRCYVAANWPSTDVVGPNLADAMKTAFLRLFGYIQGQNSAGAIIPMTVPVKIRVTIGATLFGTKEQMSFYIPTNLQARPPIPTNPLLRIEERQPLTAYVRAFSGYATETDWWQNVYLLYSDLLRNDIDTSTIDLKSFYMACYDGPYHLFNQRNEVWLVEKKK